MDIAGENANIEPHKGSENHVSYHASNMSSHWQVNEDNLTNVSIGLIPMGNPTVETSSRFSAPMAENSFCAPIWDQPINSQNLGYCDINVQNDAILKGNTFVSGMAPQSLPHFPSNSGFIERAARFSCFSSGNLVMMMDPFNTPDNLNPCSRGLGLIQGQSNAFEENLSKLTAEIHLHGNGMNVSEVPQKAFRNGSIKSENLSHNGSNEAEFSGRGVQAGSYGEGFGSRKRKRGTQVNENNEAPQPCIETVKDNAEIKPKGDLKSASNVMEGSQGSDASKEEYIHVRARRGQATNSHSLAERVRREKISERMKFLQDLVPGCSKVTGKAVMLDEIINYVQSLQRQVEFLSMKLATVNPRLDFNIEGLLAKDILQHRAGISSSLAFPSDMTTSFHPTHHPSPPGVQACLANNSSEILGRPSNLQSISASGGFKESTSQVPSIWEDELHNIVHMGFNSSASLNSQDLSDSLPPGHMKVEP